MTLTLKNKNSFFKCLYRTVCIQYYLAEQFFGHIHIFLPTCRSSHYYLSPPISPQSYPRISVLQHTNCIFDKKSKPLQLQLNPMAKSHPTKGEMPRSCVYKTTNKKKTSLNAEPRPLACTQVSLSISRAIIRERCKSAYIFPL